MDGPCRRYILNRRPPLRRGNLAISSVMCLFQFFSIFLVWLAFCGFFIPSFAVTTPKMKQEHIAHTGRLGTLSKLLTSLMAKVAVVKMLRLPLKSELPNIGSCINRSCTTQRSLTGVFCTRDRG